MSECCEIQQNPKKVLCPVCKKPGKPVEDITTHSLILESELERLGSGEYLFCSTPDCPVVYFPQKVGSVFYKDDLKVRVTQKEIEDPIPICYCFHYTRQMVLDEMLQKGKTTIPDHIRAEVKAGNCSCEITNPQGSCCLGNVSRAVKWAEQRVKGKIHENTQQAEDNADCCSI